MNTQEIIEDWIANQHGTAGWEQKLVSLVEGLLTRQRKEIIGELEEAVEHLPWEILKPVGGISNIKRVNKANIDALIRKLKGNH